MHTIFVGSRMALPLWSVVHVFDPSYRPAGEVCVCGLPKDDDIHAKPAETRDARVLPMSSLGDGA